LKTVIVGAPNAGKSSLLNLFLGFDRAIVNEQAGTTRDTIEELINLNGIPIRLIDTAGIREGEGEIEKEGIRRSQQELELAELVLLVIDSSESRDRVNEIEILNQLVWSGFSISRIFQVTAIGKGIQESGFPVSTNQQRTLFVNFFIVKSPQTAPSNQLVSQR